MATKKKTQPKKVAGVDVVKKQRKNNPPRTAFKKGGTNPHAFKPGNGSPNPGGKIRASDALMSKALRVALSDRAPDAVCDGLNLPHHSSWAQCLARRLIHMAVRGDLQAMREIREATEGTHSRVDLFGTSISDSNGVQPVFELVFVESNGDGRPAPGVVIDAKPTGPPPALPACTE